MSDPHRREGEAKAPRARTKTPLPIELMRAGMVARELSVSPPDVVFVKGLIEASEGIGALFAESGGDLTIVAPASRWAEMSELLADLEIEIGARLGPILPALGESAAAPGESQ
jgi:Domain of unknown function (DUF4911)